jgi:hypothetical protein
MTALDANIEEPRFYLPAYSPTHVRTVFCTRGWLFERSKPRNPGEILVLQSLPLTAPNLPLVGSRVGG